MNYNNLSLDSALSREFSKMGVTVKGLKSVPTNATLLQEYPTDPGTRILNNNLKVNLKII